MTISPEFTPPIGESTPPQPQKAGSEVKTGPIGEKITKAAEGTGVLSTTEQKGGEIPVDISRLQPAGTQPGLIVANALAAVDEKTTDVNNSLGPFDKPLLWNALVEGSVPMSKLLIELGAQMPLEYINSPPSGEGGTLLTFILRRIDLSPQDRLELVKLVTSLGADCNLTDSKGCPPLDHAHAFPPSEEKPLSQCLIDHGADKDWYETYKAFKGVAHSWTLEGDKGQIYDEKTQTFLSISLTGWHTLTSLQLMRQLFQDFVEEQMKPMGPYYQKLGEMILKILDRSLEGGGSTELCKELVHVSENEPVFLAGGISGHAIGFIVYKNRIYMCNRGDEELWDPGIKEYEFNRKLEAELQSFIQEVTSRSASLDELQDMLNSDLQCDLIKKIHQNPQKGGNCTWASYESGLLALLLVLTKAQNPQEISDCRPLYKAFTKFARKKTLLTYLQVTNPDPSVLKQIEEKIGKPDSPFSEEEKKELLGKIEEKIRSSHSS